MKRYLLLLYWSMLCVWASIPLCAAEGQLKVLHLTFHKGCEREFSAIAKELSLELTTWFIPDLPPKFFDGVTQGNALYNVGHARAESIWNLHYDFFDTFDIVITSDTAALSRIFLQNNWQKPLIVWICNRFDYSDAASLDCEFPDPEYYALFNAGYYQKNVAIVAYTAFEHYYAKSKGVETGDLIITPCALKQEKTGESTIPTYINKPETFFLPPYHNEKAFMSSPEFCSQLGIPTYFGRYNGAADLADFKGIIHLPYSWSNLALFENMSMGIPYFVPTPEFLEQLASHGPYFHPNISCLIHDKLYALSEWYSPRHAGLIVYFSSWEDLKEKVMTTDYIQLRRQIQTHAIKNQLLTIEQWKSLFAQFGG